MKKYLVLLFFICLITCSEKKVSVKESIETFQTYGFSDPNPVAQPDRNYYPYFRFDGYSQTSEPIEWKVIELENHYIKITLIPEIGGKVWGAIEKSTNNQFIYSNSVVKFRNIAMRGPWTSGGIEFNFGLIGHSPTTSTPVDYSYRKNKDGSVSCFIGALDLLTRIRWETEVNLQPDKAFFTTKTHYINPNPISQPYYQWSNAAFSAQGNPEMIFPGNSRIGHGGEADTWPFDKNMINLSIYENNNFGGDKSYHIMGKPEGFFAAYWHNLNFGGGYYSNYGDKLGKKIFLWSQARSGEIWEELLTDTDGQYIELQSGRLFNQASKPSTKTPFKHYGIQPHTEDVFEEYWYPILNTNGVTKANSLGILNIEKQEDQQIIFFSPLQHIKSEINVFFGEKLRYKFKVKANPLETWKKTIEINSENEPLKIIIGIDKQFIFSETENNINTSRPLEMPEDFNWDSNFGLYTQGINLVYQGLYNEAFDKFNASLEVDPYYSPSLNEIAELYLRKSDYEKALSYSKKSLKINTYDSKANFIFAQASRNINNFVDAHDGYAVSTLSTEYRISAYIELAKLFLFKSDYYKAKEYIDKVLLSDVNNSEALLLLSIITRKKKNKKESLKFINNLEYMSPLNHFARFEKYLIEENKSSLQQFKGRIKNELPYQTFLEMSSYYEYINCYDEAIKLLNLSPENVLVDIKLAYLYNKNDDNKNSAFHLNRAIEKSINFVLPFRSEFIPVLEWAINNTENWKPKYYLGLLHWGLGNITEAEDIFISCLDKPDSPYFYLSKVILFKNNTNYDSEKDLLRAKQFGIDEWRTSLALIEYYLGNNRMNEALEISQKSIIDFPSNSQIQINYARSLLANHSYLECFNVLEKTVILPSEGAQGGRVLYRQAAILQSLNHFKTNEIDKAIFFISKSRLWPENLGVGKPFDPDLRIEDFLEAEYNIKLGNHEKVEELYDNIISFTKSRINRYSSTDLLYLIILKRRSMNKEINEFLKKWDIQSPNNSIAKWVEQVLNTGKYVEYETTIKTSVDDNGTPWDPTKIDSEFNLIAKIAPFLSLK